MISLNGHRMGGVAAAVIMTLIVLASIMPAQSAITFGRWRDINPTHYNAADVSGTLRGIYVRNGGTGSIGAGDGWAVGGSTGPVISHYDGFSWQIVASPTPSPSRFNGVHFCTAPGAPGVGLCSPNGDGSDGWIVGQNSTGGAAALYYDGSGLTEVDGALRGLGSATNLTSVFMVCHSPPSGTGCPGGVGFGPGLAYAVGSNSSGAGAIYAFNGNPKTSGGWTQQGIFGATTTRYNSVYMYVDQSNALAGFAVGNGGVVARLNGGTWTASIISPGASDLMGVFVARGNPAEAWAVGRDGQIWHFFNGSWTGFVSPMGTANDLFGVFLTSTSEGWIVGGNSTILHSTTLGSGNVWLGLTTAIQTATGTGINLFGVSFPSGGNGWAVGTQGLILQTGNSNCGNAVPNPCWGGSTSITQSPQLNAVFMKGSNDAWAGGNFDNASNVMTLIHWDGSRWHRATISPLHGGGNIWGIYMLSGSEAWAVGGNRLNTTAEALKWDGSSWTGQPIAQNNTGGEPRDVFMISGGTGGDGWTVGTGGNIWRYQLGSWGLVTSPTNKDLNSVFISNPGSNTNAGWAVGKGGTVLKLAIVGGVPTWSNVGPILGVGADLYDVYFTDSNHGWIVGASSTILTTSDGGSSWAGGTGQVALAPLANLRSVFIDTFGTGSGNGDGWAVGDDGTSPPSGNLLMAHWDGASWTVISLSPPTVIAMRLHSVYLTSPTDGFAVGSNLGAMAGSLSGIIHLDPPNPPTAATTSTSTPVTSTATGGGTTETTSATTSVTSSSSAVATTTETSTSATSQETTSTVVETSTETQGTAATATSSVATSSETTPLQLPSIPGFPWQSIIAGIIIGLAALAVTRRHRRTAPTTPN